MSYFFIKVRDINDYSMKDLENNTISFGLFSVFADQSELKGIVDSKYLREKYHDTSITDENVVELLVNHINKQHLICSFAKLADRFSYDDVLPKLYKDYGKNRGFVLVYEIENLEDFVSTLQKHLPFLSDVTYGTKKFDLTVFCDCILESEKGDECDYELLEKLLTEKGHLFDLTGFMTWKLNYNKQYENETRIIIQRKPDLKVEREHAVLPFIKPTTVCIPHTLDKKTAYQIEKICNKNKIPTKIIGLI